MESVIAFGQSLMNTPFNPHERISALYLLCTVGLAFVIWLCSSRSTSFRAWLLPREVYTHRSNLLDIKLFVANKFFAFIGLTGAVFFPSVVAYATLSFLSGLTGGPGAGAATSWSLALGATVIIVMASDFCKYWAHRWHHEIKAMWPFHAVHHSADVLTPLTVMRTHPVELLVRNLLITAIVGAVQGLVLYAIVGRIDIVTIGGANALYFLFNALGANLRHSHIWLSYGRTLEHIFISPAQHQIHHSVAVRHHDKNYGSMFAIWDWMFGTLYIPNHKEELVFGVSDANGMPKPQPYETLWAALAAPFRESWQAWREEKSGPKPETAPQARRMVTTAPPPGAMTTGFSLWLDVLRAGAALTVLFGHMAHIRFTRGDYYFLRDINIASDAVIVFFVLSGVVIAYAAGRDGTLERFAFNRLTRIFSVIVPALVLTMIFDRIGFGIDPEAYPSAYYQPLEIREMLWRGLTLSNEWQGLSDRVRLGTNGPLWSLSYEAGFYLIFGAWVFLRGPLRVVMVLLISVVVGLPILALLPAWLLGVLVWKRVSRGPSLPLAQAWILAVGSIAALVVFKMVGLPASMTQWTIAALAPYNHHAVLIYSDEVLWNTVIAICVAIHLVAVKRIADAWPGYTEGRAAAGVRWLAGASFSIYVMHYPTLHLLDATLPETLPGYDLWLLGLTLSVCFVFAALFERPLGRFRAALRSGVPSPRNRPERST